MIGRPVVEWQIRGQDRESIAMAGDLVAELDALKVQLYQAVLETDGWASVASMLRDLVGSDFVALSLFDQRSGGHVQLHGDCGPEYKQLYTDLLDQNPFIPAIYRLRQGDILLDEAVSDRFEQTLFFDAWMRPQDQHSAAVHSLVARDGITGYFMFSRGGRSDKYSGRETVPLLALNTTLSHALGLQIRFARGQLEQTGRILNAQGVGWMAVDPGGRLVWTNQAAETMLAQPQPAVTARHNMLSFSQPAQARRFMTALQQACVEEPMRGSGADMIATHPESGHAVALSIVPADNLFLQGLPALHGAYVGLQDLSQRLTPGFEERIRAMFDLTPREAQLATALATGQTLAVAAAARGISMPTARTQLVQLFRKTGTGQQSQLVSLLLSVLPIPYLTVDKPSPQDRQA